MKHTLKTIITTTLIGCLSAGTAIAGVGRVVPETPYRAEMPDNPTNPPSDKPTSRTLDMSTYVLMGPRGEANEWNNVRWHSEGDFECFVPGGDPSSRNNLVWCDYNGKRGGGWNSAYVLGIENAGRFFDIAAENGFRVPENATFYIHNMKTADGVAVEYGVMDDDWMQILFESFPDHPNSETGFRGNSIQRTWVSRTDGVWGDKWLPRQLHTNKYSPKLDETVFECSTPYETLGEDDVIHRVSHGKPSEFNNVQYVRLLPYEISTHDGRVHATSELKALGLLPQSMPVEEAFPQQWYNRMVAQAGFPANSHVDVVVREHSHGWWSTETYTYGRITDPNNPDRTFGLGLLSWAAVDTDTDKMHVRLVQRSLMRDTKPHRYAAPDICEFPGRRE